MYTLNKQSPSNFTRKGKSVDFRKKVTDTIRSSLLAMIILSMPTHTGLAADADDLLAVDRPDAVYESVLTGRHVDRIVSSYYLGFRRSRLPAELKESYTDEMWAREARNFLLESAAAGIDGPFVPRLFGTISESEVEEMYEKYGIQFPYFLHGANSNLAKNAGAKFMFYEKYGSGEARGVASWDPCYQKLSNADIESWLSKYGNKPWISCILGVDEPLNYAGTVRHPLAVDFVNSELKKKYGVKLAMTAIDTTVSVYDWPTDPGVVNKPALDVARHRVAVWRWLNEELYKAAKPRFDMVRRYAPGKLFYVYNRNAINIMGFVNNNTPNSIDRIDQAILYDVTDGYSADPYPTCNLKRDGAERAMYHMGFTGKLITDLGAGKPSKIIMQGFKFHDRLPTRANLREWASQVAKVGVTDLEWFGDQRFITPDLYKEILRISRLWKDLPALDIPEKSDISVIFSDDSRNADNDDLLHAHYMLHVILGEHLGAWYTITGENQFNRGLQSLDNAKLIIAPQISWVSKGFAEKLVDRVENGATLLVLDPCALTHDIETGPLTASRKLLLGTTPGKRREASQMIPTPKGRERFKGITRLLITPGKTGEVAHVIKPPRGADTLFTYADGAPAVYSRRIGKGEVIVFGAKPFGNSKRALEMNEWDTFFTGILDDLGIERDLPIWNFLLPESGGEVATYEFQKKSD